MEYLNQQNVYAVASAVYKEVEKKYGINIEGYYLDDIQKVMQKLYEKNSEKARINPRSVYNALNKKTVEMVLPQVFRNIEAGASNKTQNSMFKDKSARDYQQQQQQQYQIPQITSDGRTSESVRFLQEQQMRQVENSPLGRGDSVANNIDKDPNELFERMKKEREEEGSYAAPLKDQKNVYSNNSYQNKQPTYENQLPMLPKTKEEVEPDADAERFINGNPLYKNERQGKVKDVGPTNLPGFFRPPDQFGPADSTGPTLDSFFTNAANLRGELNQDTTKQAENLDVENRFEKLKIQYMADGKADKPRDASNLVEDVIGRRNKNNDQFTEHFKGTNTRGESRASVEEARRKMDEMSNEHTGMETFRINERENEVVEENRKRAQNELILNNELSNNAYINYSLIPPEKLNYQTRKYYLTVDSLQRDLEAYPLPTYFQVRFEQPGDEVEIPTYLNDKGVVIYGKPVVYQNVGGRGAKFENIYQNIVELKCLDAQIPLDAIYAGGLAPYDFNGPVIDENKLVPNSFGSTPYGPIYKENYGIYVDVLDEPYYFLVVDEIDGAYDGTNLASRRALAKLNYDKLYGVTRKFVGLKTTAYEGKVFYPSNLAKLSQMTMRLVTRFNQLLNVGIDKVYILAIEQGEEVIGDRYCPIPAGNHLTKITVIPNDPSYNGQILCGTGNVPGDRVLFYSIFACNPLTLYTKLNDNVYIGFKNYPNIYFYMVYDGPDGKVEKKIDVRPFLKVGDLIIINGKYVLDITNIDGSGINVTVSPRIEFNPSITVTSKGFVNVKRQGNNEEDRYCFLAQNGQRVGGPMTEPLTFQVLYPFEMVPNYLKSPPYGFYKSGEAFYIYAKKQITYTFEVTQIEQNMEKLDSRIIPLG